MKIYKQVYKDSSEYFYVLEFTKAQASIYGRHTRHWESVNCITPRIIQLEKINKNFESLYKIKYPVGGSDVLLVDPIYKKVEVDIEGLSWWQRNIKKIKTTKTQEIFDKFENVSVEKIYEGVGIEMKKMKKSLDDRIEKENEETNRQNEIINPFTKDGFMNEEEFDKKSNTKMPEPRKRPFQKPEGIA